MPEKKCAADLAACNPTKKDIAAHNKVRSGETKGDAMLRLIPLFFLFFKSFFHKFSSPHEINAMHAVRDWLSKNVVVVCPRPAVTDPTG